MYARGAPRRGKDTYEDTSKKKKEEENTTDIRTTFEVLAIL
jgi:hypothetical protein